MVGHTVEKCRVLFQTHENKFLRVKIWIFLSGMLYPGSGNLLRRSFLQKSIAKQRVISFLRGHYQINEGKKRLGLWPKRDSAEQSSINCGSSGVSCLVHVSVFPQGTDSSSIRCPSLCGNNGEFTALCSRFTRPQALPLLCEVSCKRPILSAAKCIVCSVH